MRIPVFVLFLASVVLAQEKDAPFSIGLGVLAPSYSQKVGPDGSTKIDFNQEKDGFSYSVSSGSPAGKAAGGSGGQQRPYAHISVSQQFQQPAAKPSAAVQYQPSPPPVQDQPYGHGSPYAGAQAAGGPQQYSPSYGPAPAAYNPPPQAAHQQAPQFTGFSGAAGPFSISNTVQHGGAAAGGAQAYGGAPAQAYGVGAEQAYGVGAGQAYGGGAGQAYGGGAGQAYGGGAGQAYGGGAEQAYGGGAPALGGLQYGGAGGFAGPQQGAYAPQQALPSAFAQGGYGGAGAPHQAFGAPQQALGGGAYGGAQGLQSLAGLSQGGFGPSAGYGAEAQAAPGAGQVPSFGANVFGPANQGVAYAAQQGHQAYGAQGLPSGFGAGAAGLAGGYGAPQGVAYGGAGAAGYGAPQQGGYGAASNAGFGAALAGGYGAALGSFGAGAQGAGLGAGAAGPFPFAGAGAYGAAQPGASYQPQQGQYRQSK